MDIPELRLAKLEIAFRALLHNQPRDAVESALGFCRSLQEQTIDEAESVAPTLRRSISTRCVAHAKRTMNC